MFFKLLRVMFLRIIFKIKNIYFFFYYFYVPKGLAFKEWPTYFFVCVSFGSHSCIRFPFGFWLVIFLSDETSCDYMCHVCIKYISASLHDKYVIIFQWLSRFISLYQSILSLKFVAVEKKQQFSWNWTWTAPRLD